MKNIIKIIAVLALVLLGATQSIAAADTPEVTATVATPPAPQEIEPGTVLEAIPEPVEKAESTEDATDADSEPAEPSEDIDEPLTIEAPEATDDTPDAEEPAVDDCDAPNLAEDNPTLYALCTGSSDPAQPDDLGAALNDQQCQSALNDDPQVIWMSSDPSQSAYDVRVQYIKDFCPEGTPIPEDDGSSDHSNPENFLPESVLPE